MKELILEAGIQESKYHFMVKHLDKYSDEFHQILLEWLMHLREHEYKNTKLMWDKMSAHGWKNLKQLLDIHDLPEQILLNNKFKELRQAFFNRPRPPKKIKKKNNDNI